MRGHWKGTSCPAVPAACCQVYHKYFTKLNRWLRRKNGKDLSSLRFESALNKCFYPVFGTFRVYMAKNEVQGGLSAVRSAGKSVRCLKVWDTAVRKMGTTGR